MTQTRDESETDNFKFEHRSIVSAGRLFTLWSYIH